MSINSDGKLKCNETLHILKEAKDNNRLVLFVGAGISRNSGMPSWDETIDKIATKLPSINKPYDSLKIPQFYYNSRGKKEYTQLMRDIFLYGENLKTNSLHKKIIEFKAETIITTNYDHLIELASEENAEVRYVISKDSDLPYKVGSRELIKMHGDFENDNFVLKEDDYLHYSSNFKLIETYIKSIIGSNVVLFVGYSLNDPDVKQIISWVKEILKDDFQRAYLVLTGKENNEVEKEYFRNLGVNVIYATELVDECDRNNHVKQLEEFFNYILENDVEGASVLNKIYYKLKQYKDLNYVYGKYIINALSDLDAFSIGDSINLNLQNKNDEKDKFKKLLWDYLNDEDAMELRFLELVDKDKLEVIKDVLCKSNIKYVTKDNEQSDSNYEIINNFDNQLEDLIFKFDYKKLSEVKTHNAKKLSFDSPELYMQQAYISVLLNDYFDAYNCLKNASKIYYREKNYTWYFLAEFNRKYIAKTCLDNFDCYKLSSDEIKQLRVEYEAIDINQILDTIPKTNNREYEFLNDLGNFKVPYILLYNIFSDSISLEEQSKTLYSLFTGTAAYEKIRNNVKDYNDYETRNYIMLDRYDEVKSVFLFYSRSMLSSVISKDLSNSLYDDENYVVSNVKKENLDSFDLYIMLRYLNQNDLKKLFKEYDIKFLSIDDNALLYVEGISDSIFEACDFVSYDLTYQDIFWKYLELISHIEISDKLAVKVLEYLCIRMNASDYFRHRECINRLILNICDEKCDECSNISKSAYKLVNAIFDLFKKDSSNQQYFAIVSNLTYICKQNGNLYDNKTKIYDLISGCNIKFFVWLYQNLGTDCQKLILDYFNEWRPDNDAKDYILYCDAVFSNLIKSDKDIEKQIYKWIVETHSRKNKNVGIFTYPKSEDCSDVIKQLINLYLNNQILDIKQLNQIVQQFGDMMSKWLIDIEKFDYENFDCNWLELCRPKLLRNISKNKIANANIRKAYKVQSKSKSLSNKIQDIIVDYFLVKPDDDNEQ